MCIWGLLLQKAGMGVESLLPTPSICGLVCYPKSLGGSALLCQTYDFTFTGHYVKCYNSNLTLSNICCKNCTPWRQSMKKTPRCNYLIILIMCLVISDVSYSYKYMFCVGSQIKQKKDCRRIKVIQITITQGLLAHFSLFSVFIGCLEKYLKIKMA